MDALEKTEETSVPEADTVPEAVPEEGVAKEETAEEETAEVKGTEEEETKEEAKPLRDVSQKTYDEAYEEIYAEILEHFRSFSPAEQIAGRITEEHITEYLEGAREERLQGFKERREKRFLSALELIAVLAAIVLVVWFLGDNPAILVNILYIIGGLGAFYLWKHPHKKDDKKE